MNTQRILSVACFILSLAVLASAISPRFQPDQYTILADTDVTREYFTSWARYHGRSYASHEFNDRYSTWRDNYAYVDHFNANANATYTLAVNDMGDKTMQEIRFIFTGLEAEEPTVSRRDIDEAEVQAKAAIIERSIPSSFDWRSQNAVTPARSQGACGACYAFSANAAIEGVNKIATGTLTSISDQMILDCAQGTGNLGCSGGNMEITFMYLIQHNLGVSTLSTYPWTGTQSTCKAGSNPVGGRVQSYMRVTSGSESDLLVKAAIGPVSVGVNASPRSFAYYSSGTLNDPTCTSTGLNHAVAVIGWGTDANGNDYWLIKNSWGSSWGQSGFGMIARNSGNMCGIASMATLPCYNSDCSVPNTITTPSPAASPAASPSRSPAAPSPSQSSAPRASPSTSPAADQCTCPCSC